MEAVGPDGILSSGEGERNAEKACAISRAVVRLDAWAFKLPGVSFIFSGLQFRLRARATGPRCDPPAYHIHIDSIEMKSISFVQQSTLNKAFVGFWS